MTDREQTILDLVGWALCIYVLVIAVLIGYRLLIRNGDVVAQAEAATAEADRLIAQHASIDTFVTDWMEPTKHGVHIAEALYLAEQRSHPKKGRRR